ncbi:MAG: thiamine pyrophosphate-dependent enzyme, partial [Sciscionella sp.]
YGLTKGQYSPTSETGKVTKSTPMGSLDNPFNPVSLALGAEASFVGRALDSDRKGLTEVLRAAAEHRGSALVEIYQNCPIFNDGAFEALKDTEDSTQQVITLREGEPITFGAGIEEGTGEFAVVRDNATGGLAVRKTTEVSTAEILVHDSATADPAQAFALSRLTDATLAHTVTGVFRNIAAPTYDDLARAQVSQAQEAKPADLQGLLNGNDTWTVLN